MKIWYVQYVYITKGWEIYFEYINLILHFKCKMSFPHCSVSTLIYNQYPEG